MATAAAAAPAQLGVLLVLRSTVLRTPGRLIGH